MFIKINEFKEVDNHKGKSLNLKIQIILILTTLNLISIVRTGNYTDDDCIYENKKKFNFYEPKGRLIDNPQQCTNKTSSCCYIEVSYDFAGHNIENSYCILLGGDVNTRIQQITGVLTDQIRYYSDFTYKNYQTLTSIGNNLNYTFYDNYTCYQQVTETDYYSYIQDNCAFNNNDGTCKHVNDYDYVNEYAKLLFENITENYCNNRDDFGNCLYYDKVPTYNNTGLSPLLDYLKVTLELDSTNSTNEIDDNQQLIQKLIETNVYAKKFYSKCKPIIPARVKIICPNSYVNDSFIAINFIRFIILLFFVLLG